MKTLAALTVGLIAFHRPAFAQDREPNALYLTGEADSSPTFSGGAAEADWVHAISSRSSITLGGGSTAVADLHGITGWPAAICAATALFTPAASAWEADGRMK